MIGSKSWLPRGTISLVGEEPQDGHLVHFVVYLVAPLTLIVIRCLYKLQYDKDIIYYKIDLDLPIILY